jgi:FtsH-binding integral membrane protein
MVLASTQPQAKLRMIRLAMLGGMLLFGGVVWYMRQSPEFAGDYPAERVGTLMTMGRVLWLAGIIGCLVLLQMIRRTKDPARVSSLSIVAWALGEGVVLFGGTFWYLTGTSSWYGAGLAFLVLTFLVFPGSSRSG